ncbi:hypothetical protein OF375_00495 [Ureaplasma miroungigenitalium]|uniref:hypothetical protein n=1 Tax=Ureaplasma miroungigenitalium TaxID=1042321 RepID=UPI0021E7C237|nr:hypothetical protein [Ureaplasma miroungigenitalium]MCV3734072.1 hypothetical protein [Ureaplasma miroungigenitalium]
MTDYFFNLDLKALQAICQIHQKPKFLAKQVYQWVYEKNVLDFTQMRNISKENQLWLKETFIFDNVNIKAEKVVGDLIYYAIQVNLSTLYCTVNLQNNQLAWYVSLNKNCAISCAHCQGIQQEWTNSELLHSLIVLQQTLNKKIQHLYLDTYFINQLDLENFVYLVQRFNDPDGFNIGKRKINWLTNGWNFDYEVWTAKTLMIDILFKVYTINPDVCSQWFPHLVLNKQKMMQNMQALSLDSRNAINLYYFLIKTKNDSVEDLKQLKKFIENQKYYINLINYENATTSKVMTKHLYNLVSIFANQIVIRQNNAFSDTATCLQKQNIFKK